MSEQFKSSRKSIPPRKDGSNPLFRHLKKMLTDPQSLTPPAGTVFSGTEIVLCGRDFIEIEGCRGLTAYTEEQICMLVKEGALCISGQQLSLKIYRDAHIAICGKITGVLFEEASTEREHGK